MKYLQLQLLSHLVDTVDHLLLVFLTPLAQFFPSHFHGVPQTQRKGTQWRHPISGFSVPSVWLWVSASTPISCQRKSLWSQLDKIPSSEIYSRIALRHILLISFSILGPWAIQTVVIQAASNMGSLSWCGSQIRAAIGWPLRQDLFLYRPCTSSRQDRV